MYLHMFKQFFWGRGLSPVTAIHTSRVSFKPIRLLVESVGRRLCRLYAHAIHPRPHVRFWRSLAITQTWNYNLVRSQRNRTRRNDEIANKPATCVGRAESNPLKPKLGLCSVWKVYFYHQSSVLKVPNRTHAIGIAFRFWNGVCNLQFGWTRKNTGMFVNVKQHRYFVII